MGETVVKKCKMDRFGSKYERGVRLRGGSTYRRSNKWGMVREKERGEGDKVDNGERGLQGDAVIAHVDWQKESQDRLAKFPATSCHGVSAPHGASAGSKYCDHHDLWFEPESISYREIVGYPHLNQCVNSLEILNIGGSNVLGEFLLLHTPKLKSLGQWSTEWRY